MTNFLSFHSGGGEVDGAGGGVARHYTVALASGYFDTLL